MQTHSDFKSDPELGEVLFESRPSLARRIAVSFILLPVGLSLVGSAMMMAAFHFGAVKDKNWDVPMWVVPIPLSAGLLFLVAAAMYLRRVFCCHEVGVSTRGLRRTEKLPFPAMRGVRLRITETRWLGVLVLARFVEAWFDPNDPSQQQIAFTCFGYRRPLELASRIETIVKASGITPQWTKRD